MNPTDPAFPADDMSCSGKITHCTGMDLRTYIATAAMQGMLHGCEDPDREFIANVAVNCADALIKKLKETGGS